MGLLLEGKNFNNDNVLINMAKINRLMVVSDSKSQKTAGPNATSPSARTWMQTSIQEDQTHNEQNLIFIIRIVSFS